MELKNNINKAFFLGKLGILAFLSGLLAYWIWSLIGGISAILIIGMIFSAFFIWIVLLVKSHFSPLPTPYNIEDLKKKESREHLLLTNLTYNVDQIEEKSSYYFKSIQTYKFLIIFLGGLSTVLVGLDISDMNFMDSGVLTRSIKNIVLVLTASITVLTSLFSYWNIEKYWMTHKVILFRLRMLRDRVEDAYKAKQPIPEERFQRFLDERADILSRLSEHWELALNRIGAAERKISQEDL
jgi:hypothetical protein